MKHHLVFVDSVYGYDAARPDRDEPLGGTTSAVCFLARSLQSAGHRVTLVNLAESPGAALGIDVLPMDCLEELADPSQGVTAFVFCGRWQADRVRSLREKTKAPMIAWMHEACFEMNRVEPMEAFDGVVYVSLWQAKANAGFVHMRWQQAVIRNAMNPRFLTLFDPDEPMLQAQAEPPVIQFIGEYHRGAMHLLPIVEALCAIDPAFVFEAYTGPSCSDQAEAEAAVLETLRAHPNVRHVGKVGQAELAQRMKKAAFFLAPNPWPETSCINLIQAMTSGMLCVTTNRAALRETSHVFGHLLPIEDKDHLFRFDMPVAAEPFAKTIAALMAIRRMHPEQTEERLQAQRAFFTEHYRWETRVEPWIEFIERFH